MPSSSRTRFSTPASSAALAAMNNSPSERFSISSRESLSAVICLPFLPSPLAQPLRHAGLRGLSHRLRRVPPIGAGLRQRQSYGTRLPDLQPLQLGIEIAMDRFMLRVCPQQHQIVETIVATIVERLDVMDIVAVRHLAVPQRFEIPLGKALCLQLRAPLGQEMA